MVAIHNYIATIPCDVQIVFVQFNAKNLNYNFILPVVYLRGVQGLESGSPQTLIYLIKICYLLLVISFIIVRHRIITTYRVH